MAFPPDDKKPAPPFPPKGDGGPPPGDDKKPTVGGMLDEADAGGKLEPIKAVLKDMGRDDIDAKEVLKLAQKDDRTHGKSPDELAEMMKGDDTLLDDLMEYKDGGMFQQRGMGVKAPKGDESTDEAPKPADGPPGMKKPGEGMPDFSM